MTAAALTPPSEVWRRQDDAEQPTGVDACPAG